MKRIITIALSAFVLAFSAVAPAEEKAAEVKPEHTWDLTEIYASEEDWNAAREGVRALALGEDAIVAAQAASGALDPGSMSITTSGGTPCTVGDPVIQDGRLGGVQRLQ